MRHKKKFNDNYIFLNTNDLSDSYKKRIPVRPHALYFAHFSYAKFRYLFMPYLRNHAHINIFRID